MNIVLAIISTRRPGNVKFIQDLCKGHSCHWFVNNNEGDAYKAAGADWVLECGTNICSARNTALEYASRFKLPCVQISDDLRSIKQIFIDVSGKRETKFVTVEYACNLLVEQMQKHDAYFGGVAVTNNPLNYSGEDVSTDKLIVNDLICLMPGCAAFDEQLALKEDYDMCVRQLLDKNRIVRLNNILCDFPHRQNEGGANAYRNEITEAAATSALMAKWPKYIVPHKTRPGQVSLNYKAINDKLNGIEPVDMFNL